MLMEWKWRMSRLARSIGSMAHSRGSASRYYTMMDYSRLLFNSVGSGSELQRRQRCCLPIIYSSRL